MSSTTKSSAAVAATALLSITTPFVQPPDCKTQWRTASTLSSLFDGTMQTTLVKVSEPASTCYPSGWDDVAPESRLRFSPGVCPEGWTYNRMAENGSRAATTAFCCDNGFTYASHTVGSRFEHRCSRWGWNIGTEDDPEPQTRRPLREVTMVHEPWAVTWAASDTATLTPKLPTITSSMTVPQWTPGETIRDGQWDYRGQDNAPQLHFPVWLTIVLPIVGVLILGSYIWCGVRACYKRRRERRVIYVDTTIVPPGTHETDPRAQKS